ncbi:MAG: IclR family transcriptional regulator [Polaromonas sp.]|nr:MAG: IclR family transcriptional regulator [Polaromonas sp.]
MPRKAQTESLADSQAAAGGAAAVDRALSLLTVFKTGDSSLSLNELASRTRLYKSTALRQLASLEHAGFVQRLADGSYALGSELARLGSLYAASFSLDRVVLPALQALVNSTRESAAYHVLQGQPPRQSRLCLLRVDSPQSVRDNIRAGDILPLDKGSGARILIAFDARRTSHSGLNDSKIISKNLQTPQTLQDQKISALIRQQGFFAAVGDRLADVAGISAPVFRRDGSIAGALTLSMPAHRYDEKHVLPVLQAARGLAGLVG